MDDEQKVSMVICIKCLKRWIALRPIGVQLVDLVCPNCGLPGAVIETGEDLGDPDEMEEEYGRYLIQ